MRDIRLFVEKKEAFQTEVTRLKKDIAQDLNITLKHLRKMTVYEVFNVDHQTMETLKWQVFGEIVQDDIHESIQSSGLTSLAYAYLPGQYDMRADSAMQCIQLITGKSDITVLTATLILCDKLSDEDYERLKNYVINPVEMGEKNLISDPKLPNYIKQEAAKEVKGFILFEPTQLKSYYDKHSFAMKYEDIEYIQTYFKTKDRNPSETEIYVLDTYWSDHCRHTTFETIIDDINIEEHKGMLFIKETLSRYLELRNIVHSKKNKPMTLMDMATLYGKYMIKEGLASDIEISEEVNACSVKIDVEGEIYLLMFKNETHNHPTEIEPFGGASTCIGGAIRDPLSGRAYVYQAARVTGAANILSPLALTRKGKIPQSMITKKATEGFSAYGNQIGLATTLVREIYHLGYEAKRLELGAVVGAVKLEHIQRKSPLPGDFILLIGGATGRDGIGGATGSSKSHDTSSLDEASSEVQKGNAPIERKLQRLFLNPEVTKRIKKANDFGAGGVCVAIGELARGIHIDLDQVPTKYFGLNATELAISESQERMAIVISPSDLEIIQTYVELENLKTHHVATVTDDDRLVMIKDHQVVVDLDRAFLDTNGIKQHTQAQLVTPKMPKPFYRLMDKIEDHMHYAISSMQTASQQGMIEYFDSTIGQTTVLMPFGGKYKTTENDASVQKIPIKHRKTDVTSILTFGFDPEVSSWSPYHGAYLAVVEAISKVVAVNGNYRNIRFSFQEYFQKLEKDHEKWGSVVLAMLGALQAQDDFKMPAIGGKDSMSGTFEDIHVPPTFVAFAVTTGKASTTISPEFKSPHHYVYLVKPDYDTNDLPHSKKLIELYDIVHRLMSENIIISAKALLKGGWLEAVTKMSFGNALGFNLNHQKTIDDATSLCYGGLVIESTKELFIEHFIKLGQLTSEPHLTLHDRTFELSALLNMHQMKFNTIYPITQEMASSFHPLNQGAKAQVDVIQKEQPIVTIASFPGTNCELDSKHAFEDAGAKVILTLFRNQDELQIKASITELAHAIDQSDIFMIPGGFSAGDEPDGSGKFIAAVLLNPTVKKAIENLQARKGLIIGICNGFQALIKSGLLPYGRLGDVSQDSPTLTLNHINRHVSQMVYTKVINNHSPWYQHIEKNAIHHVPISHGEGRFYANKDTLQDLIDNMQISTVYVNLDGDLATDGIYNPNGSVLSIEGITSPDGRILGKMAHSERYGDNLYKNIPGNTRENIFKSAIETIKRGH